MTALFERLSARLGAAVPLAVPGLQLVPKGAIALAEHVNRYYRVLTGADPQNVAVRLPTGGGSFEVRHSATNAALLRVTDAGLDFPAGGIGTSELADGSVTSAKILDNEIVNADVNAAANILVTKLAPIGAGNVLRSNGTANVAGPIVAGDIAAGAVTSAKILDNEIVDADINAAAAILVAKLAHVGAGNVLKSNGTANVGGQVVNADIAAAGTAQIAVNKLLHVGAGNVLRSDGAQNVAGQVVTGDIANGTILDADINAAANINGSKLLDNSVSSAKLSGGLSVPAGSITTAEIADGTIVNVDINAAAAILVAKLAHVGAGNVLRSDGAQNVAGQVVTGDIANGTILDADINAAAAIALAKLAPGAAGLLRSNGTAISAGNQAVTADIADGAVGQSALGGLLSGASAIYNGAASTPMSMTTPCTLATTGGPVMIVGWVSFTAASASVAAIAANVDGVGVSQEMNASAPSSGVYVNMMIAMRVVPSGTVAAPVSHTFGLSVRTTGGVVWQVQTGQVVAFEMKK